MKEELLEEYARLKALKDSVLKAELRELEWIRKDVPAGDKTVSPWSALMRFSVVFSQGKSWGNG